MALSENLLFLPYLELQNSWSLVLEFKTGNLFLYWRKRGKTVITENFFFYESKADEFDEPVCSGGVAPSAFLRNNNNWFLIVPCWPIWVTMLYRGVFWLADVTMTADQYKTGSMTILEISFLENFLANQIQLELTRGPNSNIRSPPTAIICPI